MLAAIERLLGAHLRPSKNLEGRESQHIAPNQIARQSTQKAKIPVEVITKNWSFSK
jgi:hypothetical protein